MPFARKNFAVTDPAGNVVNGASVEVRRESSGALVQLYADRDGETPLGNPFVAMDGADAGFHTRAGAYKITATKDGFEREWRYEPVGLAQESDAPQQILTQDDEPDTTFPLGSLWIDRDSADNDLYVLSGDPAEWVDTGRNLRGMDGVTIFVEDDEPDTTYAAGSLWIDADSANLDLYVLEGSPLEWVDTGRNLQGNIDTVGGATLTGGFDAAEHDGGTVSSGTYTPDPHDGNLQKYVNGGAHTLAPPGSTCSIVIQVTNNGSAGAVTTSGWTKVSGDLITTTNGHDFLFFCTRINGFSHLHVQALQ